MHLVIFDIDGTLTDTNGIDHRAYFDAYQSLTGIDAHSAKWEHFVHFTDLSITRELYRQHFDREPLPSEINAIQEHMLRSFEKVAVEEPEQFRQVPGSGSFFDAVRGREGYAVAIGTGCWSFSAQFKLGLAGFPEGIAMGHSDHHYTRHAIAADAVRLAKIQYGVQGFERITYLGDGTWDLKTSALMNFHFVGIDVKSNGTLRALGAKHVFTDYLDQAALWEAIESAPLHS